MLQFFEHENASAFTHDETVAALAEGTRSACGVIVASGEGVHSGEATNAAGPNGGLGTTSDDGVGLAQADEVERIGEGVGRRGASRSRGIVRAVETVLDRNLSSSDVGNHLGDEEGIELGAHGCAIDSPVAGFFFKRMDAADTYTEDYADAVLVNSFEVHTAVLDSLLGSHEGILLVEVHLAHLFAVEEVGSLKALHLASKLGLEVGSIKVGDRCSTADTILNVFPSFGHSVTDGGQGTETCDDHSFQFHNMNLF